MSSFTGKLCVSDAHERVYSVVSSQGVVNPSASENIGHASMNLSWRGKEEETEIDHLFYIFTLNYSSRAYGTIT